MSGSAALTVDDTELTHLPAACAGVSVVRGRFPGSRLADNPAFNQNIYARELSMKPSSGMTGEDCSQPLGSGIKREGLAPSKESDRRDVVELGIAMQTPRWALRT